MAFHQDWGDGIVVSDGLGSKPFSDFGSHAACLAATRAVRACLGKIDDDHSVLSEEIHNHWVSLIAPLAPSDCAATCLLAFRTGDGAVLLGMLGDGLAAVLKLDGTVVTLSDEKTESFSNITSALSTEVSKDWRWLSVHEEECESIILCTDGVADDLIDTNGFIKAFVDAHRTLSPPAAMRSVRDAFTNWPTPKHCDDKTIACLLWEEVASESA